jgi:hypothetical protein
MLIKGDVMVILCTAYVVDKTILKTFNNQETTRMILSDFRFHSSFCEDKEFVFVHLFAKQNMSKLTWSVSSCVLRKKGFHPEQGIKQL